MSLSQVERDALIDAAVNRTREEFAGEVAQRTTLTQARVLALAKTAAEREALAKVLAEVTNASATNTSKTNAVRNIAGGVEALVKTASLVL
jgi:hypothetical protein